MLRPERDVTDLRLFYHSRLGRWITRRLAKRLRALWPDLHNQTLVGLGYALPYLSIWQGVRTLAVMPASQGVSRWPLSGPCATVLTEDHVLPFADESIDRLVIAHELENTDYLSAVLNESWRILKPEGRLLVIVPNRLGLWVRSDATPFGYGRAFSSRQLRQVLQAHRFVWQQRDYALFAPPVQKRIALSFAAVLEWIGTRLFPHLGGLIIAEATKQVYNVMPSSPNAVVTPPRKTVLAGDWNPSPAG